MSRTSLKVLNGALKADVLRKNRQQGSNAPLKTIELAPSAKMTKNERDHIAKIRFDLVQECISPERWALGVLARGATVIFDGIRYCYSGTDDFCKDINSLNNWVVS